MPTLPLAVDIAETISEANRSRVQLDVAAKADQLLEAHPEAEATLSDIADTLREESVAIGLVLHFN